MTQEMLIKILKYLALAVVLIGGILLLTNIFGI